MTDVILAAYDLHKTYRLGRHELPILRGLDLEVHAGEAVVIRGRSGAGKTTLLHLLGGLDVPTSGTVTVAGQSLYELSNGARTRLRNRQLGFVFQSYNLLPELDALENVSLPALLGGQKPSEATARAIALLQAVGLGDRLEHRPPELSGGEQQRVAIARALINQPRIILADEPTGNLDPVTGEAVLDVLWQLRAASGTTLVMVTHDEHIARRGERVLELRDGRLFA